MGRKRNPVVFNLPEQFNIKVVKDFYDEFSRAVSEERIIVVDLGKTDTVDFSGLQLLHSLKKTCEEKSLELTLENISESLSQKIKLCGLQNSLLKESTYGSI